MSDVLDGYIPQIFTAINIFLHYKKQFLTRRNVNAPASVWYQREVNVVYACYGCTFYLCVAFKLLVSKCERDYIIHPSSERVFLTFKNIFEAHLVL